MWDESDNNYKERETMITKKRQGGRQLIVRKKEWWSCEWKGIV